MTYGTFWRVSSEEEHLFYIQKVVSSILTGCTKNGVVAQLVECCPEEAGVGGSSPSDSATSGYSITVIMPVFQTDDVSSILTTRSFYFALSSNGRTCDFGSQCVGSNPAGATKARAPLIV